MKSIYLKLVCLLIVLTTFSVKAQEQLRDTVLAQKAIFDIENPRFAWAVQEDPTKLCMGLSDDIFLELKNENTIWFSRKSNNQSHLVAKISSDNPNGIITFTPEIKEPECDSVYFFNPMTGILSDSKNIQYTLTHDGTLTDPNGKALLVIGKTVEKKLAIFYIINFYSKELENKKSNSAK